MVRLYERLRGEGLRFAPPLPPHGGEGRGQAPASLPPLPLPQITQWGYLHVSGLRMLRTNSASTPLQLRRREYGNFNILLMHYLLVVVLMEVGIRELLEETDVSTQEATAYVKYFDYKLAHGYRRKWEHYTVRAFVLSVAYLGNGYYSVLRKVKDEVVISDARDMELFSWLKGWIFKRDRNGQWWLIVDGDSESFDEFKKKYEELTRS